MATSAFMTELEAVNLILEASEEAPVASLDDSGLIPLRKAKAALLEASRSMQSSGWSFNREDDYPLTRLVDGTITLPDNLLRLDVEDTDPSILPVQRGARLYDKAAHSFQFSKDLKATVVLFLEWQDLPQTARYAIAHLGARIMQSRSTVSEGAMQATRSDLQAAMLAFTEAESHEGDYNMLRDDPHTAAILMGY